jgi:hypothetical protein
VVTFVSSTGTPGVNGQCKWELDDASMPCNGKLWLFASCPNPEYGNVFELEIHENDLHVYSFYIEYDPGDVACLTPGEVTFQRRTANPPDQCDWDDASATITLLPCDEEISSDSGCLWSTSCTTTSFSSGTTFSSTVSTTQQ